MGYCAYITACRKYSKSSKTEVVNQGNSLHRLGLQDWRDYPGKQWLKQLEGHRGLREKK